jgi:hypothetical protein
VIVIWQTANALLPLGAMRYEAFRT